MVGREVGEHADRRAEMRRVVELERATARAPASPAVGPRSATSHSGRPMLPADSARRPAAASRCAMSDVVVVLPLVPVIPMQRVPREREEPDVDLGVDLEPGRTARRRAAARRAARPAPRRRPPPGAIRGEVVAAELDPAPELPQRRRPGVVRRARCRCPRRRPGARDRAAAASRRHRSSPARRPPLPAARAPASNSSTAIAQRTLSVERAISAQNRPRM